MLFYVEDECYILPEMEHHPPGVTILPRPLRLRRRGYYENFTHPNDPPNPCCRACLCSYCFYISKGAVCLRGKKVMAGLCPCAGCRYNVAVAIDSIRRRQDLVAVAKVLQGKSREPSTNFVLAQVLRYLLRSE